MTSGAAHGLDRAQAGADPLREPVEGVLPGPRSVLRCPPSDLVGPVSSAVAIGIQLTLTSLLFLPLPRRPPLTTVGTFYFKPEWDGRVYVAAGLVCVGLAVLLARRARHATGIPGGAQAVVAGATTAVHLVVFLHARHALATWPTCWPLECTRLPDTAPVGAGPGAAATAVLAATTALCLAVAVLRRPGPAPSRAVDQRIPSAASPRTRHGGAGTRIGALDPVFPLLLVAVVYVPGWRQISGRTFDLDGLIHWDYFAMGPTLAFRAGAALATDVHTFYGVGWPMVYVALSPLLSVSYSHMILVAMIAGCAYMVGAYVFLRVLLRNAWWAATGSGLVLLLQVFARDAGALSPYWGFPSATVIRSTFDVWCLLTLVLYQRSAKKRWAATAGALAGLAVLFEIDTGIYLTVAAACFLSGTVWLAADRRAARRAVVAAGLSGATVLLAGLAVASRGTLVHARFWSGWLENLRTTSGGFSMEPLVSLPPDRTVVVFAVMTAVYLMVIGWAVVAVVRRRGDHVVLAVGALAVYGYLTTLYFVGRSSVFNLPRASVPFALLLAGLAGLAHDRVEPVGPAWRRLHSLVPLAALGLVATLVATNPLSRATPASSAPAPAGPRPRRACWRSQPTCADCG